MRATERKWRMILVSGLSSELMVGPLTETGNTGGRSGLKGMNRRDEFRY